ncbi:MAG: hypothetical protein H6619_00540 [Deltaproteobacteria bacterium]|nr:hypothetical protein [Deltaproteobacteria bacterium]
MRDWLLRSFVLLSTLSLSVPAALSQGFDYIGANSSSTASTIPYVSQMDNNGLGWEIVTAQPWIPTNKTNSKELWAVFSADQLNFSLNTLSSWHIEIWSSQGAFVADHSQGDVLSFSSIPDLGSTTAQYGTAGGGVASYLIGFSIPETVLLPGVQYFFSIYTEYPISVAALGVSESSIGSETGFQHNFIPPSTQYLTQTAQIGGTSYSGTAAYKLVADEIIDLGPGAGVNAGSPPVMESDFPKIGQNWTITVTGMQPFKAGTLYFSLVPVPPLVLPFGYKFYLPFDQNLTVPLTAIYADANGNWTGTLAIPNIPAWDGIEVYMQGVIYSPAAPLFWDFTNGLKVTLRN